LITDNSLWRAPSYITSFIICGGILWLEFYYVYPFVFQALKLARWKLRLRATSLSDREDDGNLAVIVRLIGLLLMAMVIAIADIWRNAAAVKLLFDDDSAKFVRDGQIMIFQWVCGFIIMGFGFNKPPKPQTIRASQVLSQA